MPEGAQRRKQLSIVGKQDAYHLGLARLIALGQL
jgi:hypothetical protein